MQTEIKESIVKGLQFTSSYIPDLTDSVLHLSEPRPLEDVAAALHKTMRRTLPVPVIYTSLKIMMRLVEYAKLQQEALDNEVPVQFPKTKNNVDHTVKRIFRAWNQQVSKYCNSNSDFKENGWNPWTEVINTVETVAKRNLQMFFGLEE